jgi:hypothetical protein
MMMFLVLLGGISGRRVAAKPKVPKTDKKVVFCHQAKVTAALCINVSKGPQRPITNTATGIQARPYLVESVFDTSHSYRSGPREEHHLTSGMGHCFSLPTRTHIPSTPFTLLFLLKRGGLYRALAALSPWSFSPTACQRHRKLA